MIRADNGGAVASAAIPHPVHVVEPTYTAVGYARLSVFETRDRLDSEALQNQKALLRQYIKGHPELKLLGICEDNGQTGTNFNRKGFERMMELIRSGQANCIVVKDLSRFGRDYLETGNYLEHIFPFMGVRFISISDGYDSADATTADCLTVALKNMVNHMYSKDISRKSGSVLREKMRRGEFIGAYAAYGYLKDPADKHRMIIDPEAAEVVRSMFQWKLDGLSHAAITRRLNAEGVPSPGCYRFQKGIILDRRFAQYKPWKIETVKSILTNQVYLGHLVQGRRRAEFYAGRPDRLLPREEWTVVENTHEAIVSREAFEAVQTILLEKNAAYQAGLGKYDHLGKTENILKGLVYCADCGRPMVRYKQVSHGQKVSYFYLCPNYAALLEQSGCSYKYLREDILIGTLEQVIQKEIELAVDAAALVERMSCARAERPEQDTVTLKRLNAALERVEQRRRGAMADYVAGLMSRQEHECLKVCCVSEAEKLKAQIKQIRARQQHESETLTRYNPWLNAFGTIGPCVTLNKDLSHAMIKRITVFESNRVEVTFRFQNEKEQLLAAAGVEVNA